MMRWFYSGLVVLFWLASMTWLVTDRILPAFQLGDAPLSLPTRINEPVGWRISIDNKPVGLAVMQAVPLPGRVTEVHNLVSLEEFSTPAGTPLWLAPVLTKLGDLQLTVRSTLTYDVFGELSSFNTRLKVGELDTPLRLYGRVDNRHLQLTARFGEMLPKRFDHPWPNGARLTDGISPAARLLPLYQGRQWTREVFNPLASPQSSVELIQAAVTERLRLEHNGESIDGWRVEYRALDTTGSTEESRLRATMFVDLRGNVLRQDLYLLGSRLTLDRVTTETAQQLADEHLELGRRATDTPQAEEPPRT